MKINAKIYKGLAKPPRLKFENKTRSIPVLYSSYYAVKAILGEYFREANLTVSNRYLKRAVKLTLIDEEYGSNDYAYYTVHLNGKPVGYFSRFVSLSLCKKELNKLFKEVPKVFYVKVKDAK